MLIVKCQNLQNKQPGQVLKFLEIFFVFFSDDLRWFALWKLGSKEVKTAKTLIIDVETNKLMINYHGEFDSGSELTLAARLKHASRTVAFELA